VFGGTGGGIGLPVLGGGYGGRKADFEELYCVEPFRSLFFWPSTRLG